MPGDKEEYYSSGEQKASKNLGAKSKF